MKSQVFRALAVLSAAISLAACSREASPSAASAATRVVVDAYGRSVEIPATIKSAVAIGGAARIMSYAGCADRLVGVNEADKKASPSKPYSVVNAGRFASIAATGSGGSNDTPFIEKIAELGPDVIIGLTDQKTIENVAAKTGIPVVAIYPESMFHESFYFALDLIGKVMGTEEHCARVVAYVKACQADLDARTRDVPEAEKPSVYTGAVSFRGGHGFEGTYANYPPFVAIHAKNVTDQTGQKGAFLVDMEKVLAWDPDIIFLNPANMKLVNEAYAKNPAFYDGLSAVKRGAVYAQIPYNSNWTNMEISIADAYYAGKIIYPQRFSDVDIEAKADEIFTAMLGQTFYRQLVEAGMPFGPITIGK